MQVSINSKEFFKIDNVVLAILSFFALLFGYLSFAPAALPGRAGAGKEIAVIAATESTVKRKAADGLAWNPAATKDSLYDGDQIFTDTRSNATVRFQGGAEISVAENSLVKIERKGDKTTIDMSQGFISGKLGDGAGKLAVKLGGTQVRFAAGSELQIKVDPNDKSKTRIALLGGTAAVQSSAGKVSLAKDQILRVDQKTGQVEVEDLSLTPLLPATGARIDSDISPRIVFEWAAKTSGTYSVLIARDAQFKDIAVRRLTTAKALSIPAPQAGTYYWKVRLKTLATGKSDESVELPFTVLRLSAPELTAPLGGKSFEIPAKAQATEVPLLWQASQAAADYEVQLATSQDFAEVAQQARVAGTVYETPDLGAGAYYWRVRGRSTAGRPGPWSQAGAFRVSKAELLPSPPGLSPVAGFIVGPGVLVPLSWQEVPQAAGYQIDVSRSADFGAKTLAVQTKTTAAGYDFMPDTVGTYHWRVRALDRYGRATPYSETRSFEVKALDLLPPPRLRGPYYFSIPPPAPVQAMLQRLWNAVVGAGTAYGAEANAEVENGKVIIHWQQVTGATLYAVEVARDQAFTDVLIKQRLPVPTFTWPEARPGRYWLRAASVDARGRPGPYSKPAAVTVNYQAPQLYAPADHATLAPTATHPQVQFTWQKIAQARHFTLEVATAPTFAEPLLVKELKHASWRWVHPPDGTYYWRVQAQYRASLPVVVTKPRRFTVRSRRFAAPEVTSPPDGAALLAEDLEPAQVPLAWQAEPGAARYLVEVARDGDFKDPVLKQQTMATTLVSQLPPGSYNLRVTAEAPGGGAGEPSVTRTFTVKPHLAPPTWRQPTDAEAFKTPSDTPKAVTFAWTAGKSAHSFELEVAKDGDFSRTSQRLTPTARQATLTLAQGTYAARVRVIGVGGEPSTWSKTKPFTVTTTPPGPPDPVYPPDGDRLPRGYSVKLAWSSGPDIYSGYRVVVSRDPRFKQVVSRKTVRAATATSEVALPGPGSYYWYVEGQRRGKRYAAVRSDIASFHISTFAPAGGDKLRLVASYAPSLVSNTMTSPRINNSLAVVALNSFSIAAQYWLTRPFGFELRYERKSAKLYDNKADLSGSSDQNPLPFTPQDLDLRGKLRFLLASGPLAPEVQARLGYMFKTFYTYYAASRTSLGLAETKAHHLSLGLGGRWPFTLDKYAEAEVDFAMPLGAAGADVRSGSHLSAAATYYMAYADNLTAGLGYRFTNATYQFTDAAHDVAGTLQEKSYSLVASLGWAL